MKVIQFIFEYISDIFENNFIGKSDLLENLRENEWINKETKQHTLRGLGIIENVKKPLNKKAKVSAIESPHPGISYNPSFEDHQNLLKDVVDKELKIMKEEQHINRVTRDMFRKVTRNENAVSHERM